MLSKLGILVSLAFVGHAAMASYAVECGKTTDAENGKVEGSVFALSSEDDRFEGTPSKDSWQMTYLGVDYPPAKGASARVEYVGESLRIKALQVSIVVGKSPSGPVGQRLVVSDPYSDEPTLDVYQMGGFAGGVKSGSYKCLSFID